MSLRKKKRRRVTEAGKMKIKSVKKQTNKTERRCVCLPDVHGEAAAAGHRVLIGPFQSDAGFGPSADFAAEDHRLPEGAHHV